MCICITSGAKSIASIPIYLYYHGLFYRPVDVLKCVVVHQTAVTGLNRKTTGWEWAHGSTVMLAMDLATFCGIVSMIGPHLGPLTLEKN